VYAALAAGIGITAYTLLVGASPSVARAAIVGGLALFSRQARISASFYSLAYFSLGVHF